MGQIKGKVVAVLPIETGISKAGKNWQKSGLVIATENPDKEIYFSAFGRSVDDIRDLAKGDEVSVEYALSSREYNGKYYTDAGIVSIRVERSVEPEDLPIPDAYKWTAPTKTQSDFVDDLPF